MNNFCGGDVHSTSVYWMDWINIIPILQFSEILLSSNIRHPILTCLFPRYLCPNFKKKLFYFVFITHMDTLAYLCTILYL